MSIPQDTHQVGLKTMILPIKKQLTKREPSVEFYFQIGGSKILVRGCLKRGYKSSQDYENLSKSK